MGHTDVMYLMQQALRVAAEVAMPALLASLIVGVAVSVMQAATSVQEMSLSFIPKVITLGLALLVMGNWMLGRLTTFSHELFMLLPRAAH